MKIEVKDEAGNVVNPSREDIRKASEMLLRFISAIQRGTFLGKDSSDVAELVNFLRSNHRQAEIDYEAKAPMAEFAGAK